MDRNDIGDAITLFQYSNTARSGGRAKVLVARLQELYNRKAIYILNIGKPTLHGDWDGHKIRVNSAHLDSLQAGLRLGALSLVLVHEGTHAIVHMPDIYDELAARLLPIHYFRELTGPGVFNEASDPPRPGRRTQIVRIPGPSMPWAEKQSTALTRDQLIDYLFSHGDYDQMLDPQWIVDNLRNWRGIGNRLPETKGKYIGVLAKSADNYFTRVILDIMESVKSRAEWDAMMGDAGSKRAIRVAVDTLSAAARYGPSVVALERQWGIHLHDDPPPPPARH
jgi:hypothetical protein